MKQVARIGRRVDHGEVKSMGHLQCTSLWYVTGISTAKKLDRLRAFVGRGVRKEGLRTLPY